MNRALQDRPATGRRLDRRILPASAAALALALGLLSLPPGASAGSSPARVPAVDRAIRILRAEGSDPAAREAAMAELRGLAGGPPGAPETREAILELALYRVEADPGGKPHRKIADLIAATSLYPDDSRVLKLLPKLAELQLSIDDPYGAHLAYRTFRRRAGAFADGAQAAEAARTAVRALDMRSAMDWSGEWLDADLSETDRTKLYLARLQAAAELSRLDEAQRAVRVLELQDAEALRLDADAVWTAAQVADALGHEDDALRWYGTLANLHPGHPEHPAALLALERLHRKTGQAVLAAEEHDLLVRAHPDSREARTSRLEWIANDPERTPGPARIDDYLALAREASAAGDAEWLGRICDETYARLTGAGYPLEAVMGVLEVAADDPDALGGLVARRQAAHYLEPAIGLLASRGETLEIAALAAAAEDLDLRLPDASLPAVNAARAELGLPPRFGARMDALLADVRRLRDESLHPQVLARMKREMRDAPLDPAAPPPWLAEATLLYADSLWRETEIEAATARIDRSLAALDGPEHAEDRRALLALRGDVLFTEDRSKACASYRAAAGLRSTPWTAAQVARCDAARSVSVADSRDATGATGAGSEAP